jgi:thiosulfate reductase cytochrome b subunit
MLITFAFVYVLIGAVLWMVLDGLGILKNSFAERLARGNPTSMRVATLATAMMILCWPKFAWAFVKAFRK